MKKRNMLAFLIIFIISVVGFTILWKFARQPVLNYLLARKIKLEIVNTAINTLIPIFSLIVTLLFNLRKDKEDYSSLSKILVKTSPDEILKTRIGSKAASINWIDRDTFSEDNLRQSGFFLLEGRMKVGKTREAAELIRRMITSGIVPDDQVYDLSYCLRQYANPDIAKLAIKSAFDIGTPAVFFIDEITRNYQGSARTILDVVLSEIHASGAFRVVATARSDQIDKMQDRPWLENNHFKSYTVRPLEELELIRLVDNIAGILNLQIDERAIKTFSQHADGTPYQVFLALNRIAIDGHKIVSPEVAEKYAIEEITAAWDEVRRIMAKKNPDVHYVFSALDVFYNMRITPTIVIVRDFALTAAYQFNLRAYINLRRSWNHLRVDLKTYGIIINGISK